MQELIAPGAGKVWKGDVNISPLGRAGCARCEVAARVMLVHTLVLTFASGPGQAGEVGGEPRRRAARRGGARVRPGLAAGHVRRRVPSRGLLDRAGLRGGGQPALLGPPGVCRSCRLNAVVFISVSFLGRFLYIASCSLCSRCLLRVLPRKRCPKGKAVRVLGGHGSPLCWQCLLTWGSRA